MVNNLNDERHILNEIINCDDDSKLALGIFCIKHYNQLNSKYISREVTLVDELRDWLKKSIKDELNSLKVKSSNGDELIFLFNNYNDEFNINDSISVINVDEKGEPLKDTLSKMLESIAKNEGELKNTNFYLVKVELEEKKCYIGYYRGFKKNGNKKKYGLGLIESDKFSILDQPLIEFGGTPQFIIHDNYIYVINPKQFEYAFKYTDHITQKRDENLSRIVSMSFFSDTVAKETFFEKSKNHLRARAIAQISEKTFTVLEDNFNARCEEIKIIKQTMEDDPTVVEELKENAKVIIDLFEYLDLDNHKIIFNENSDPTPLLHLFQDKIVESFLTKRMKIAISN